MPGLESVPTPVVVPQRVRELTSRGYGVSYIVSDSDPLMTQVRISRDPIHWFFQLGLHELEAWLEGQYVVGVWENFLHPSTVSAASVIDEAQYFGIRAWHPEEEQMNRAGNIVGAEAAQLFMRTMSQPSAARQVLPAVEVTGYSVQGDTLNLDMNVTIPTPAKRLEFTFIIDDEKPKDIAPPPRRLIDIGSNEQE